MMKNEKHTSSSICEIDQECCVDQSSVCKLRVVFRSRVLRGVYPRREGYRSLTPVLMPGSTGLRQYVRPRVKIFITCLYLFIEIFFLAINEV